VAAASRAALDLPGSTALQDRLTEMNGAAGSAVGS